MASAESQGRDPKKPFTPAELKSIQLAVSWLEEYHAGYVHIERMRAAGDVVNESPLDRFFELATTAILDGFYPPGGQTGLIPILRLVGCKHLADSIEGALNRQVGSSTFAEIQNLLRDKTIAHPQFTAKAAQPFVDSFNQNLQRPEDIDAFCDAAYIVKRDTAAAFLWFKQCLPELVAHATSKP